MHQLTYFKIKCITSCCCVLALCNNDAWKSRWWSIWTICGDKNTFNKKYVYIIQCCWVQLNIQCVHIRPYVVEDLGFITILYIQMTINPTVGLLEYHPILSCTLLHSYCIDYCIILECSHSQLSSHKMKQKWQK